MSKNLRKISASLRAKLDSISETNVIAAVAKSFTEDEIKKGTLNHLGIRFNEESLVFPSSFIPLPSSGRVSKKNTEGYTILRKDLPKVYKTLDLGLRPIFGDWSKGSRIHYVTKLVYQKDSFLPSYSISIELIDKFIAKEVNNFLFKFSIEESFEKTLPNFEDELLFALNILQENIGISDIYPASASSQDFMVNKYLNCEFLPPGEREDDLNLLFSKFRNLTPTLRAQIQERYDLLRSMAPLEFLYGISGIRRYFGAKFSEDLVVFENLEFGNAIYIFFENWELLSRMTRKQILNRPENDYIKINHSNGWQDKLRRTVSQGLNNRESAA